MSSKTTTPTPVYEHPWYRAIKEMEKRQKKK
jgi:hypothetical protein